jgi:polyisoprenoid-binding protein YceI
LEFIGLSDLAETGKDPAVGKTGFQMVMKGGKMKPHRMLNISQLIFVLGLLTIFSSVAYSAETYKLDPAHTSIVFRVKHLGISYVFGRFNGPTGSFVFDESSPSKSAIEMQAETNNVDTAVGKRDTHLKSPDIFMHADPGEHNGTRAAFCK